MKANKKKKEKAINKIAHITEQNLEELIIRDLKEMDRDMLMGLVEHLYCVNVNYNLDTQFYSLMLKSDEKISIEEYFGKQSMKLFEKE